MAYSGQFSGRMTIAPPWSSPLPVLYSTGTSTSSYSAASNPSPETETPALPAAQESMICTPALPFCAETTRSAAGSGASGVSGKRNSCFVLSTPSMAKTS